MALEALVLLQNASDSLHDMAILTTPDTMPSVDWSDTVVNVVVVVVEDVELVADVDVVVVEEMVAVSVKVVKVVDVTVVEVTVTL